MFIFPFLFLSLFSACLSSDPVSTSPQKPEQPVDTPAESKDVHEKLKKAQDSSPSDKLSIPPVGKKPSLSVDLNPRLEGEFVYVHPEGWCFVRGQDDKDPIPAGLNQPAVRVDCPAVMKKKPLSKCPGGLVRQSNGVKISCTCITSFLEPRPEKMVRVLSCR
jgi:hypothetical protein